MPTQSMNLRHATFFSRRCGRVQLELVRRKKGCKMKLKFLKVFVFIMIAVNAVLCVCATDLEKVWLDGAWQYKDKDGVIWRIINITDGVNKWVRLGGGSSAAIDVNTIGDVVIPSESVTDTAKPISEIYKKAFYNCINLLALLCLQVLLVLEIMRFGDARPLQMLMFLKRYFWEGKSLKDVYLWRKMISL